MARRSSILVVALCQEERVLGHGDYVESGIELKAPEICFDRVDLALTTPALQQA
ncbi:hypothetical protein [uncultured Streptomyces sp.]|uniref:hypothetical protein n=1 Tax=uncultured Streptomyces sp. TaxID=174707 RepID=UPI002618F108|nr:hypothetical protein [uncultured Streptomyces sp.]